MDNFLKEQTTGTVVNTKNPFTVERTLSRDKLLDSIPPERSDAIFRLLDSGVRAWGFDPTVCIRLEMPNGNQLQDRDIEIRLPTAKPEQKRQFLEQLRRPFGELGGASQLARAVYRAAGNGAVVQICFSNVELKGLVDWSDLTLTKGGYMIPESLAVGESKGLSLMFHRAEFGDGLKEYRKSPPRKLYRYLEYPERLQPLESLHTEVSGYFDYRTKPFTAIRSYAAGSEDEEGLKLDLWEGPYESLDPQTFILDKKKPGKFLFFRWRPNYGRPTFLHHQLDSDLKFERGNCKGTFWVSTTDQSPRVYFYSCGMVSDPVNVEGPRGLTGLVIWPGLTFDIWGSRLVQNSAYRNALEWAQEQVDATAQCLSDNLPLLTERLEQSNLLKSSYRDETLARIQSYWQR